MITLFLLAFLTVIPTASSDRQQTGCYTFTADNLSKDSLGTVTVSNGVGDNAYFDINATGQYQQQVCFVAYSATIAGISIPYPNTENIPLPNGDVVKASWQSPSLIELSDGTVQERPAQ